MVNVVASHVAPTLQKTSKILTNLEVVRKLDSKVSFQTGRHTAVRFSKNMPHRLSQNFFFPIWLKSTWMAGAELSVSDQGERAVTTIVFAFLFFFIFSEDHIFRTVVYREEPRRHVLQQQWGLGSARGHPWNVADERFPQIKTSSFHYFLTHFLFELNSLIYCFKWIIKIKRIL